jgi:hypothetical protein
MDEAAIRWTNCYFALALTCLPPVVASVVAHLPFRFGEEGRVYAGLDSQEVPAFVDRETYKHSVALFENPVIREGHTRTWREILRVNKGWKTVRIHHFGAFILHVISVSQWGRVSNVIYAGEDSWNDRVLEKETFQLLFGYIPGQLRRVIFRFTEKFFYD